jgi:hypothetical protein
VSKSATNFVAYHSVPRMGYAYSERTANGFFFKSSKSRAFLERAIGSDVWVIEGRRDAKGATQFGLAAVYTPDTVDDGADHFLIQGEEGREFSPPIPLNGVPWFEALVREQSNFSFGFNEIHDPGVVAGLAALAHPAEAEVQTSSPTDVAIEAKVAVEASAPEATDNASRVARWLRQRRGHYYCHHCISREAGITPIAQVNQIVRPLQQAPKEWRCGDAPCSGCGRERKCIAYVG